MDVDGLPIIGPGLDYTQIGAIHQKRTLAFINHFISNTVSFLNKFARSCEQRLEKFDARLQKLNAALCILEAKLNSISGLENVDLASHPMEEEIQPNTQTVQDADPVPDAHITPGGKNIQQPMETDSGPKVSEDPRFARFFRMIQVGVPVEGVRRQMQAEGFDPSVLNNLDAVVQESKAESSETSDAGSYTTD